MADGFRSIRTFLAELKRRKVYRVVAVYLVAAIAGLELVDVLVPASNLPEWSDELLLSLAVLGLPLATVLAWAFEITPDGVKRTHSVDPARSSPGPAEVEASPAVAVATSPEGTESSTESLDPRTVAVLPFENLSGTEEAAPFAAGLHDDLLTELSRFAALTVISRTSVMGYRASGTPIRDIGRELRAGTVVEGGVQKSGDRLRLNVQLIDARSDVHRWAERYDRGLEAVTFFDIQSELAQRIADSVRAKLTEEELHRPERPPTDDLEAYRLYAQGRDLFHDRTEETLSGAVECFEQAVERDPEYAPAWAGLANALILLADYRHVEQESVLPRGEAAARRALELSSTLADAHAALGNLHSLERKTSDSIRHHRRAVELQPSYAAAHLWLCWANLLAGAPESALRAGQRAARLDPKDPEGSGNLAIALLGCGRSEEALAESRRTQATHPRFDYTRWAEGLALYDLGNLSEGARVLQALTENWTRFWPRTSRGLAFALAGDQAAVRDILAHQDREGATFHTALLHASLGDTDEAISTLRASMPLEWDEALFLRYHRRAPLDSLRDDASFHRVIDELDRSWGVERER